MRGKVFVFVEFVFVFALTRRTLYGGLLVGISHRKVGSSDRESY
jgi:hypothetical protein